MGTLGFPFPAIYFDGKRLGCVSATSSSFRGSFWALRSRWGRLGARSLPISPRFHSSHRGGSRAQVPANGDEDDGDEHPSKKSPSSSSAGQAFPSFEAAELRDTRPRTPQSTSLLPASPSSKPPYGLITGLASVGLLETAYLTWAKIGGGPVTCPIDGNCKDVLDSSYATVFGIPLALIGVVAYGFICLLGGIGLDKSSSDAGEKEMWVRWILLASTSSMAVASSYFMYILVTKLEGASCAYCVSSAILSFALLLSSFRGFTMKDMRTVAGLQLGVVSSVVIGLTVAFSDANADWARSQDLDLPPVELEVVTVSSSKEISLAKHLRSIGARMYGAFWCSHCYEQKEMFGREAMKIVDYVECYPEGYRKGVKIAEACNAADIQGFPTWIIKGKTFSGEQNLEDLAKISGFDVKD